MKNNPIIKLTAIALVVSHQSLALDFQGNPIGGDLLSFVLKHDKPSKREPGTRAPHVRAIQPIGLVSASVNLKFDEIPETVGGVPTSIWYYFVCESVSDWNEIRGLPHPRPENWRETYGEVFSRARLAWVSATFDSAHFTKLGIALTEKFGPPTESTTVGKQNRFGAKTESKLAIWDIENFSIRLEEHTAKIGQGSLFYSSHELKRKLEDFAKQEGKDAARDL